MFRRTVHVPWSHALQRGFAVGHMVCALCVGLFVSSQICQAVLHSSRQLLHQAFVPGAVYTMHWCMCGERSRCSIQGRATCNTLM
jgi:hypothetical protein